MSGAADLPPPPRLVYGVVASWDGWAGNRNEAERDEGSQNPPPPRSDGCSSSWSVDQNRYKPNIQGCSAHISSVYSYFTSVFMFWSKKKRWESHVCHRRSDGRVNVLRRPKPDKHTQQTNPSPANHPGTNSQNDCFKDFKKKYTTDNLIKSRRERVTHICREKVESDVGQDVGFSRPLVCFILNVSRKQEIYPLSAHNLTLMQTSCH